MLKDIITLDEHGNRHFVIENTNINSMSIQVGNMQENFDNRNTRMQNETENGNKITLNIFNCKNVRVIGEPTVEKSNCIFNIEQNGKRMTYDLRTDEGVESLRDYLESQRESDDLNRNINA